jgi:hypothetical protein
MDQDKKHADGNVHDEGKAAQDKKPKDLMEVTVQVKMKEASKAEESHHAGGKKLRREEKPQHEKGEELQPTIVAFFDENDRPLEVAPLRKGQAKLSLPRMLEGRVVRVLHAPAEEGIKSPSLARLRRNLAVEERVVLQPGIGLVFDPAWFKRWRRSCCRVRGRVFMKVTLPNGTIHERPLCNARVIICEVDASIRGIIEQLPGSLVYRLRDEWLKAVRAPQGATELSPHLKAVRDGLHLAITDEKRTDLQIREPLLALERVSTVSHIREGLIKNIELLRPFWCGFDWLHRFYDVDCIKTVEVDEHGNFDTEIYYPCYGDHPDLYFKVEQDCHPGGWLTVHAPSVHCNTHWDYCCGKPVSIEVTHPNAVPGPSPLPCVFPHVAGDPASVGTWELLPNDSGVFVVHAALLRTGKVLMFSGTSEIGLPKESRVWDPVTGTMTSQSFGDDLFCSGHAQMPDGRILVNGGSSNPGQGIKSTHIFDPVAETWTKVADMNYARWYPTTLTLPDGRIITFSGRATGAPIAQVEVYDAAADTWTELPPSANKSLDIYPSLHVMPDGKILYTGTRWAGNLPWLSPPASSLFDPATNTWTDVDDHEVPNRTEAFSVLLPPLDPPPEIHEHEDVPKPPKIPPTLSRVLVVGGPGDQRSAEIIDMAEATPLWKRIADMSFPRTNVNGAILPDGNVLICAGIDGYKWGPNTPTLQAELFDPQSEAWTTVASMSVVRQYHSVSLLLPDGRVLNVGGVGGPGNIMSMEVYSPPYLFRGPRPTISSSPASIIYDEHVVISSPDVCRIREVVLIRATTITHHTNTDQRYLPMKWHPEGRCELHFRGPANPNIAPPGFYMLFLLDDCGVPSVARLIRLG